jgi:hypothetical protein
MSKIPTPSELRERLSAGHFGRSRKVPLIPLALEAGLGAPQTPPDEGQKSAHQRVRGMLQQDGAGEALSREVSGKVLRRRIQYAQRIWTSDHVSTTTSAHIWATGTIGKKVKSTTSFEHSRPTGVESFAIAKA